jgi:hypothetical protein
MPTWAVRRALSISADFIGPSLHDPPTFAAEWPPRRNGHLTDAGGDETAFRPDEVYISNIAHKFLENRNDSGMLEFLRKRNFGEHANSDTGEDGGPDRLNTVGQEIPLDRHAESTFLPALEVVALTALAPFRSRAPAWVTPEPAARIARH